jgi:hypothetical protein
MNLTLEELSAELGKLSSSDAAKALRLAHGFSCAWPRGSADAVEDPADDFDGTLGVVREGVYAMGFENYYATTVLGDGVDGYDEVQIFETYLDAMNAAELTKNRMLKDAQRYK